MDKEWLYLGIVLLVSSLVLIVAIVNVVRWFMKVKSGEIVMPMTTLQYYRAHSEEFSIEHTYSIMKSPMGQNILKKNRKRIFAVICLIWLSMAAIYFSPQWLKWLGKRIPFVTTSLFTFIFGVVVMVGAFIVYLVFMTKDDTKVWICPYCGKELMRIELPSSETYKYQNNPKAIFIRHRWGRRNLLLVADRCPYCGTSYIVGDGDNLYEET